MIFYFIPFFCLFFKNNRSTVLLFICFVFLVLFAGGRADFVGTDTTTYLIYFYQIKGRGYLDTEPLWLLLNKAVLLFNGDFNNLKFLASILTLLPLFLIFKRLNNPFFALFIYLSFYYYFYSFNIMRQCIAMSWAFYGVFLLNDDKPTGRKWGWIWFLFAWGFHVTAIVVPLFYYIRKFYENQKFRIYLTLIFSAAFGLVLGSIFLGIAKSIFTSYSDLNEASKSPLLAFIDLAILNIGFAVVYEGVVKRNFSIWFYFFFVFVVLTNLMVMMPFGNRFIFYAGIMLTVFLSNITAFRTTNKKTHNIIVFLIVLYAYFRYFRLVGGGGVLPYVNTMLGIEIDL